HPVLAGGAGRGRAELRRPRRPAAAAQLGADAGRRPDHDRLRAAPRHRPGAGDPADRAGAESAGRGAARPAGPEAAAGAMSGPWPSGGPRATRGAAAPPGGPQPVRPGPASGPGRRQPRHPPAEAPAVTGLLAIRDLRLSIGDAPILNGVSLDLARGEVLALTGESGSGKSLTALSVLGLLPEAARLTGAIRLEGRELTALPERDLC